MSLRTKLEQLSKEELINLIVGYDDEVRYDSAWDVDSVEDYFDKVYKYGFIKEDN